MPRITTLTGCALAVGVSSLLLLLLAGCDDAGTRAAGADADAATQASARTDAPRGFTGVFHSSADGSRSVLNLTDRGGKLTGMLDSANISGQVTGTTAIGDVRDATTAASVGTIDLALSGDAMVVKLTALDPQSGAGLQLPAVTYTRGAPPPVDVQLDAQLTGRWRHTWAPSGGAGAAVNVWLVVNPDGSVEYGKSSAPGGDAGAGIDTASDDGFAGRWRTSDRTLHVMPGGSSRWVAFARYQIEGQKLTLTFNDGARQVYQRQ